MKKKWKGKHGQALTTGQINDMFKHFAACRSVRATAARFKVSPNTVRKYRDREDWLSRLDKITTETREQTDKAIVRGLSHNVENAQKIADKIAEKLLKDGGVVQADPHAFVRLAKYIDETLGDQPANIGRDLIINVVEQITSGTDVDRRRMAGNFLGRFGVFDKRTMDRLSKVFPGKLHSPDGN